MPVPSNRSVWLAGLGLAWPLVTGGSRTGLVLLAAWDLALLLLLLLDGRRPRVDELLSAERVLTEPLTAFAANQVSLRIRSEATRPLAVRLADAPPPGFEAAGHRRRLTVPAASAAGPGTAQVDYAVTPRSRGRHRFGDLHLRLLGPLGLAWHPGRIALAHEVSVYPDLHVAPGVSDAATRAEPGREARHGRSEGREFASLRHYLPGDDLRSVDWKATARRGWPVVREWQPERNQTVWVLLDCGRSLGAQAGGGRTRLDRAVEAALALARAAADRGDKTGLILFSSVVERVVPAEAGRTRLSALAEALHLAVARPVEADHGAAFDELLARQRRRALVVLFTDLSSPDATELLLARAELLRRRHLVAVASLADADLLEVAGARPARREEALARAAAERIVEEREAAGRRLAAAGVAVIQARAGELAAAVVRRYATVKERGLL